MSSISRPTTTATPSRANESGAASQAQGAAEAQSSASLADEPISLEQACAEMSSSPLTELLEGALEGAIEAVKLPALRDASASRAVEGLKQQPKPISGAALEKAIIDGTQDLDGQAAGREYRELKQYVSANWDQLSPDAKAKWRVYDAAVQRAKARGQTGIPAAEYNAMVKEMKTTRYQDAGAGKAIEELRTTPQPISGDDLQKAILDATKDRDGRAAGAEYNDLARYVKENWDQLSPEAKAKWEVYENKVKDCRARGLKGIPTAEYDQMVQAMKVAGYQDAGAGKAIEDLKTKPQPISGEDLERAILEGTKDWDGQSAGAEYNDLAGYVKENWDKLSPDAKAKWRVYEETVNLCQAFGLSGIPGALYEDMKARMDTAGYQDAGAGAALEKLNACAKPVSGADMERAIIDATKDFDGQGAGKELQDIANWAAQNWHNMSPEARAKFAVYAETALKHALSGNSGIPANEYAAMVVRMKLVGREPPALPRLPPLPGIQLPIIGRPDLYPLGKFQDASTAKAVRELDTKPKPLSGADVEKAILSGTKDLDGQAAGREFNDLARYIHANWDQLSPDAKAKWRVYEAKVQSCRCRGLSGIPRAEYDAMVKEMKTTRYQDAGAGKAIEDLRTKPQPISGDDLQKAILDATKDRDGRAAGAEYNDLAKYVKENWNQLSPEAKAKWKVYESKVKDCQARGLKGIPTAEYDKMVQSMKIAGYRDRSSGTAIERLKEQPAPISGEAMERAILDGTRDLDGGAASREWADFAKFARENWQKLSPEAQAKFRIYEKYVRSAQARGHSGIPAAEHAAMIAEMKAVRSHDASARAACALLDQIPGQVGRDPFVAAMLFGTADADGQTFGAEYRELAGWVAENRHRMSPDALAAWNVYEKTALSAQRAGHMGCTPDEYMGLISKMLQASGPELSPITLLAATLRG